MATPSRTDKDLEEFETRSLTMAAYLHMCGFTPTLSKRSEPAGETVRPFGVWRFSVSSSLDHFVELFQNREASVEPTEFHNMMSQMRREVIAYLEK